MMMMMMMIALEVHLENCHACCQEFVKFSLKLWIIISLNFSTW